MPGSTTTPGHTDARTIAPVRVAFRPFNSVGTSCAAQWPAYAVPCRRFGRTPRGHRRTARGRCGSLHLHRKGPSLSTPCRFTGALHVTL